MQKMKRRKYHGSITEVSRLYKCNQGTGFVFYHCFAQYFGKWYACHTHEISASEMMMYFITRLLRNISFRGIFTYQRRKTWCVNYTCIV